LVGGGGAGPFLGGGGGGGGGPGGGRPVFELRAKPDSADMDSLNGETRGVAWWEGVWA
jgi:hypothetical protein